MIRRILREAVRNVLSEQTLGQKVEKELNAGNKNYINAVGEFKNIAQSTGLYAEFGDKESFAKAALDIRAAAVLKVNGVVVNE